MFTFEISELALYFITLLLTTGIIGGTLYLKKKLNLAKEDFEFARTILKMALNVSKEFDFDDEEEVQEIMAYVLLGLDKAIDTYDVEIASLGDFKGYVFEEARLLCEMNEIEINEDLEAMLHSAVDYLIEKV